MFEMIRTSLIKFLNNSASFLTHVSKGRPGEAISGKTFQHYGFRSIPPAGSDLITLQEGNNNYSVAENYNNVNFQQMQEGDLVIYTKDGSAITMQNSTGLFRIYQTQQGNSSTTQVKLDPEHHQILLDITQPNNPSEVQIAIGDLGTDTNTIKLTSTVNGVTSGVYINTDGQGKIDINSGNMTIDKTPTIPGTLAPLATQDLVTAIQTFMVSCAAATDPHASEIKAAAVAFNLNVPSTFVTQATKAL